jgi:hypothetical protein
MRECARNELSADRFALGVTQVMATNASAGEWGHRVNPELALRATGLDPFGAGSR